MAPRKPAPSAAATAGDDAKPRAPRKASLTAKRSAAKTAPTAATGGAAAKGKGQARKRAPKKAEEAPKKNGRPSTFSQAVADEICERIALGETLTEITSEDGKPSPATVWRWQRGDEGFRKAIAHAREEQTRVWADQIIDLADDSENDWTTRRKPNGETETVFDREHIERIKVRISARQWLMAKVNRAEYGDKQTIDHNHNFADLDTRELARRITQLLDKLGVAITPDEMERIIGL